MSSEPVPPPPVQNVESQPRSDQSDSPHGGPQTRMEDNPFGSREGILRLQSSRNNSANGDHGPVGPSSNTHASMDDKDEDDENATGLPELPRNSVPSVPSPTARYGGDSRSGMRRQRTGDTMGRMPTRQYSAIDYIVPPPMEVKIQQADIKHRLEPTIRIAKEEKAKYELKARWTGYTLNAAIGLQVLLGSLTTGLSAAATSGRSAAVQTTILGGLSTIVASYLARSRGTNEPEKSNAMVKELSHFIRECEAFEMDHGHVVGKEMDHVLLEKRRQLEVLLGHTSADGTPTGQKVDPIKTSPV